MKKFWMTLVTLILAAIEVEALPIGNPWEASLHSRGIVWNVECVSPCDPCTSQCSLFSLRTGFYGDFVFNRHMRVSSIDATVHNTTLQTEAGYLALNFCNRFDLFATLGATSLHLASPEKAFGDLTSANDYGYLAAESHFSWSLGLRGTLWECGCLGIGAEAQYFRTKPHINFTREDGNPIVYQNGRHLRYHEWQIGLGAAYRINIVSDVTALVPYIGVKWGRALLSTDNLFIPADTETFFDMETQRHWGYAVGVTLLGCNKISVTTEARFADEKAFYVNTQFRF